MSQSPADGVPPWDAFSGDGPGCAPPPGPELAALLGEAVEALDELDERQLLGASSAARRMRAHADYLEVMAVAEFARRRAAQLEASKARGDRARSRDAEYPAEELGFEMTASAYTAGLLLEMAANIVTRLPSTLAGMAAGVIDRDRARVISNATLHLPDDLAAEADKILADAAPGIRLADLQKKAARLEARLDPEGVAKRRDEAGHDRRVELRREDSGAACLSGRELDPAEALAGKASIDAEAVRLRNAGLPGTLAQIRAAVLLDRIAQRSPWDRLAPPPTEPGRDDDGDDPGDDPGLYDDDPGLQDDDAPADPDGPVDPHTPDDAHAPDAPIDDDDEDGAAADAGEEEDEGRPAGFDGPPPGSPLDQTGRKTPLPALINITIPAGTLLGWSNAPADVGSWGLMDADTVRDLIQAASRHPRTRWCYTLTSEDGQAIAHACARGTHPWPPPTRGAPGRGGAPADPRPAQLADLLVRLNAAPEPIARGPATTATARTATPPAGSSSTSSALAPTAAAPPAAAPRPSPPRSTTPPPTPPAPPASATSARSANATTTPSTHPAGNSTSPSPASCAGPPPPAAPTPPTPPNTKSDDSDLGQQGRPPRVGGLGEGARVEATDRSEHFFERRPPAAGPQRAELAPRRRRLLGGLGRGGDHDPVRADRAERAQVEVGAMLLGRARRRRRGLRGEHQVIVGQLELVRAPGGEGLGRAQLEPVAAAGFLRQVPHRAPLGRHGGQRVGRDQHVRRGDAGRPAERGGGDREPVGAVGLVGRPDQHDVHRPLDGGQHRLRGLPGQHHDGRRIVPHGPIIAPPPHRSKIFSRPPRPAGGGDVGWARGRPNGGAAGRRA